MGRTFAVGKWIGGTQRTEGTATGTTMSWPCCTPWSTARQQTSTQSALRRPSGPLCMARLAPRPARP
eukprot:12743870-Alexandrium_andersonii.AAC.1